MGPLVSRQRVTAAARIIKVCVCVCEGGGKRETYGVKCEGVGVGSDALLAHMGATALELLNGGRLLH